VWTDKILDIDYYIDGGFTKLKVVLSGRPKKIITLPAPFKPYFFIRVSDLEKAKPYLSSYVEVEKADAVTVEEEPVVKISVPNPPIVKEIREVLEKIGIPTWEADIPYVRRVMIDTDLKVAYPERIAAFDIEVDATKGFPDVKNPESRMLAISLYDGEEEIFISDDDEEKMLVEFNKLLDKYDALIGWNSAGFDYPYIVNRSRKLGVKIDLDMFQHIDLFGIYYTYFKRDITDFKLKTIAQRVLGDRVPIGALLDFEKPGEIAKLTEFFQKDREKLKLYNMDQAKATWMIAKETGVIQTYITQCRLANILPWHRDLSEKLIAHRKYISYNKIVENLVLKKAIQSKPRIVFPSKKQMEEEYKFEEDEESSYTGALVFDPVPGLWNNVVLLDFAAMYPRVIVTFNISYDTWTPNPGPNDILAPHGGFITKREGLLPQVLRELEQYRSTAKKIMEAYPPESLERILWNSRQFAFKLILVSAYGVAGFKYSRLYRVEIAESITGYTRDAITKAKEAIESIGWRVLYGDTDSIFIYNPAIDSLEKAVDKAVNEVVPSLNSFIRDYVSQKWRVPKERVVLEFKVDRVFSKLKLLKVKKRYYGLVGWEEYFLEEPYILIKGLEARRGDWPDLVKELQSKVIEIYLKQSPEEARKYVEELKKKVVSGQVELEKLALKKHLSKNLSEYKHDAPHIRAARELLKINYPVRPGDRIEYIFLDDQAIPLTPGLKLTKHQLEKWWKKYAEPVVERLEIEMPRSSLLEFITKREKN
jgi:DNA polymerase I